MYRHNVRSFSVTAWQFVRMQMQIVPRLDGRGSFDCPRHRLTVPLGHVP
jgi:hypothetical protein